MQTLVDATVSGLSVLMHWQTYIAVVEYLVISFGPLMGVVYLVSDKENAGAIGCVAMLLSIPLQVIALAVLVLTLSPILLNIGDTALWTLPWAVLSGAPGVFFGLVGKMLLAAIACSFVPFLNAFKSLPTMAAGWVAVASIATSFASTFPGQLKAPSDLWPGLLMAASILVIANLFAWAAMFGMAYLSMRFEIEEDGAVQFFLAHAVAPVLGFLPIFVYGAWVGQQM